MLSVEAFSLHIMIAALAPLAGAFTLLFLFIFERRIDLLEKEKREIALERELQTALYNQLNQEIQPHFFFNTLNSILSLARLDRKRELIQSIETLSKLLKFKYQTSNTFITVDEELTYVNYYLEIQKIRFRDRLQYQTIIDPAVYQAITIPFLIQTFVENAFKHSFEKYIGEANLKITIEKMEKDVHITVWNNSPVIQDEPSHERGVGLENITKRLNLLFPDDQTSVRFFNSDSGTSVVAIFPYTLKSEI